MKKNKFLSALVSMILTFCMLLISMSTVAFAATTNAINDNSDTINYVSLGDSMTNGYGLDGYGLNQGSGVEQYSYASYANAFAAYLAGVDFQDWLAGDHTTDKGQLFEGTNATVDHAQLAMSAMRIEDIHWLLEFDYNDEEAVALVTRTPGMDGYSDSETWWTEVHEAKWNAKFSAGDFWTWNNIANAGRTYDTVDNILATGYTDFPELYNPDNKYTNSIALVAKYYQEHVRNADIISFAFGNADFGVWLYGRLSQMYMYGDMSDIEVYDIQHVLDACSEDFREKIDDVLTNIDESLEEYIVDCMGAYAGNPEMLNCIKYYYKYAVVSFLVNYKLSLDRIAELNPNAEIILTNIINVFDGMSDYNEHGQITVSKVCNDLYDNMNDFITFIPTYMQATTNSTYKNLKFYYAEISNVEIIANTFDELIDQDPNGVIRDRFVKSIVGYRGDGMIWSLLGFSSNDYYITLDDILMYEGLNNSQRIEYIINNPYKSEAINIYLAFEQAIIRSIDGSSLSFADSICATLTPGISYELNEVSNKAIENTTGVYNDLIINYFEQSGLQGDYMPYVEQIGQVMELSETLSDALCGNTSISGLLKIFGMSVIANGIGMHPSSDGHKNMFNAISDAYYNENTANESAAYDAYQFFDYVSDYIFAYKTYTSKENGTIDTIRNTLEEYSSSLEKSKGYLLANYIDNEQIETVISTINVMLSKVENLKIRLQSDLDKDSYLNDISNLSRSVQSDFYELVGRLKDLGDDYASAVLEKIYANFWKSYKDLVDSLDAETAQYIGSVIKNSGSTFDAIQGNLMIMSSNSATELYNALWIILDTEVIPDYCNHHWVDATCVTPKTCFICDTTEGELGEHCWDVENSGTCSVCGEKLDNNTPGSDFNNSNNSENSEPHNCNDGNWFRNLWNSIINFFRSLFGKPKRCICGEELV